MTTAADGLIISGALVEMTGAGNWTEGGYQQYQGRPTASIIWNSTGYYNPNGGYLYGWKNVLWNADARVNQDGVFRGTNLIVAGQLDASLVPEFVVAADAAFRQRLIADARRMHL